MSTKNNPGAFDCYANAAPDEPMFVVLGRDSIGGALVRFWAAARPTLEKPGDAAKIIEALQCANAMDDWCTKIGRKPWHSLLDLLPYDVLADAMRKRGATVTDAPVGGDFERGAQGRRRP